MKNLLEREIERVEEREEEKLLKGLGNDKKSLEREILERETKRACGYTCSFEF